MKSETTAPLKIALSLRIPATLNVKLLAEAEKEKRSRHAQIIYTLEKSLKTPPAHGKKETMK